MHLTKETAAALHEGCALEKINLAPRRDELVTKVDYLNALLVPVCQQPSLPDALQMILVIPKIRWLCLRLAGIWFMTKSRLSNII